MKSYFMNRETGEILDWQAMQEQFRNEYDGDDPTNVLDIEDVYEEVSE